MLYCHCPWWYAVWLAEVPICYCNLWHFTMCMTWYRSLIVTLLKSAPYGQLWEGFVLLHVAVAASGCGKNYNIGCGLPNQPHLHTTHVARLRHSLLILIGPTLLNGWDSFRPLSFYTDPERVRGPRPLLNTLSSKFNTPCVVVLLQ